MGLLLELHRITVEGLYPCGGEIRKAASKVFVTGAGFDPSPPYMVENRLNDLFEAGRAWPKQNKSLYQNVAFAGRWFHAFLQIHPFMGGNGRVSRAMLTLILYDMGVLSPPENLLAYIESRRHDYIRSLQEADQDKFKRIEVYFVRGVTDRQHERTVQVFQNRPIWQYLMKQLTHEQRQFYGRSPLVAGYSDARYVKLAQATLPRVTQILRRIQAQAEASVKP